MATSTTNLITFVPGRRKGKEKVILNGYRFTTERTRNENTYMRCVLYAQGCKARITVVDRQLISPIPSHPTHDTKHSETQVHIAKQTLKRKAAETDLPTKHMIAESVNGMSFETRAKLNCQLKSLGKMARHSRKASHNHPSNPRTLEHLILPPDYIRSNSNLYSSGTQATPLNADDPSSSAPCRIPLPSSTQTTS